MVSIVIHVVNALVWIYSNLIISMDPVGDDVDLSLGFGDGGDISPSPMADVPPPPSTQMSASYLFTRIRTDKGMLINILAVVSALLIGVQALLGSRRRRFGRKEFVRLPLWGIYTISLPVVSYTIGLVQSVESRGMPDSQLLWAVGLLLLLGSVNGMSAFSRRDIEQSTETLVKHVFQTLLVLWLLYSRSYVSDGRWFLLAYFLLCWVYSIFRMAQTMKALRMASSAHGLVRGATVVADYMKDIVVKERQHDPKDMDECKYLVVGEDDKDNSEPPSKVGPPYLTKVGSKVVKVGMIWTHKGKLLHSAGSEWDSASALKHTCLSFALFKLLKRRFCGLDIAEAADQKTMDFVVDGLLAVDGGARYDYERAFRVVEVELSFMYDFFYTKYPALFPTNRLLGFIRFFVLLGFFKVLLDFMVFESPSDDGDEPPENTFIYFNNVLLIAMLLSIDILQHLTAGYSDWAVVQFVCDYVSKPRHGMRRCWKRGLGIRRALMKLVAAWRWQTSRKWWWSPRCWDNKLGQYSLLESYEPSKTKKTLSWLSLHILGPKTVPLAGEVRKEVLDSLRKTRGLPCVGRSLKESGRHLQLHWACDHLPTHTHTVLVWHIATTMCDLQDTDRPKNAHRRVATTLSGYCAYLLAFVPDMLPDNSYKATQILDAVVAECRAHLLGARDMPTRCDIMFQLGEKKPSSSQAVEDDTPLIVFPEAGAAGNGYKAVPMQVMNGGVVNDEAQTYIPGGGDTMDDTSKRRGMTKPSSSCSSQIQDDEQYSPAAEEVEDTKILILAAHLGRQLRCVDKPWRWELLARFWAELLLFLAPSSNADIHAEHLATGGEFITHLWALLTHAGIVERPVVPSMHASPV
jgi:hypothetical protein